MANFEHLEFFKQGVEVWNKWREENPELTPDLSGKELLQSDGVFKNKLFPNINFSNANLSRTSFYGFYFHKANFCHADLYETTLPDIVLSESSFRDANLSKAKIIRCNLEYSDLRDADLTDSIFNGCGIYGVASWGVTGTPEYQSHLRITKSGNLSSITVGSLEFAHFISLILNNKKIKSFVETTSSKLILILGRFTNDQMRVLEAIWNELYNHNYVPVLFTFEGPYSRDLSEAVLTLAAIARFIIADITDPASVPAELERIVHAFDSVPIKPLLKIGCTPYALFSSIQRKHSVLPILRYENVDSLLRNFEQDVIDPAENKAKELQAKP